jgi:hypothetical protein
MDLFELGPLISTALLVRIRQTHDPGTLATLRKIQL